MCISSWACDSADTHNASLSNWCSMCGQQNMKSVDCECKSSGKFRCFKKLIVWLPIGGRDLQHMEYWNSKNCTRLESLWTQLKYKSKFSNLLNNMNFFFQLCIFSEEWYLISCQPFYIIWVYGRKWCILYNLKKWWKHRSDPQICLDMEWEHNEANNVFKVFLKDDLNLRGFSNKMFFC